ncbi:unnamed protein product [Arctogadus glacialis]
MPLADPVLLGCLSSSPPPTTLHPDWDVIVSLFVCGLQFLFESTDANDVMKTYDHPGNGSGCDVPFTFNVAMYDFLFLMVKVSTYTNNTFICGRQMRRNEGCRFVVAIVILVLHSVALHLCMF